MWDWKLNLNWQGLCDITPEGYHHLTRMLMHLATGRVVVVLEVHLQWPWGSFKPFEFCKTDTILVCLEANWQRGCWPWFQNLVIWSSGQLLYLLCHPSLAILIQWENSALNHQLYHVNLKLFLYIFLLPMVFFPNQILLHTLKSTLYFVRIIQSWKWQYCQNMFFFKCYLFS